MQRPGFSFLVCPDSRLARLELQRLLKAYPAPGGNGENGLPGLTVAVAPKSGTANGWQEQVYWADEELPPAFWEDLTLQGLFSAPKAVILRQGNLLPAESWKKLSAALGKASSDTWPFIFMEVDFDKGRPKVPAHIQKLKCWEFAEKQNWIWSYGGLEQRNLPAFVRDEAKRRGLSFAPGAFEAIITKLPLDATALLLELDKLELAAHFSGDSSGNQAGNDTGTGNKVIGREQAALLVHEPDMDIFAFIRAVQEGKNPAEVWRKLNRDELSGEGSVFSFLALLLREARILWQLLSNEPVNLPPSIMPIRKRLAQNLGFDGLAQLWELAFEAERGIKSGERSPEQAHEALVAGLMRVFRAQ